VKLFGLVDGSADVSHLVNRTYTKAHKFSAPSLSKQYTGESQASLGQNGSPKLSPPPHADTDAHFKEF
jgi:hypothetical protein